jgi:GTP-binding protein
MIPDAAARKKRIDSIVKGLKWKDRIFSISAISGEGTQELCYALMQLIDEMKESKA